MFDPQEAVVQEALRRAGENPRPSPKQVQRLGETFGVDLARWALQQAICRERAPFDLADQMLFTPEALEQATHPLLAEWRASRFPAGALVTDMTCGIGADLLALAKRGPVVGYELDPERAAYARHNLRVHGFADEVRVADGLLAEGEYLYADPARRTGGQRTLDPDLFTPHPGEVADLLARAKLGGMKLSPLMADETLEGFGGRLEFVSAQGECREALIWLGTEVEPGRFAVHVECGETVAACGSPAPASVAAAYLFDPDPALVRSHASGCFNLPVLGVPWGFLTGEVPLHSPWLKSYRVLHDAPFETKRWRGLLREHGGGQPVLKQRGPKLDLAKLQKVLTLGSGPGKVVAFYEVQRKIRAALLEPL